MRDADFHPHRNYLARGQDGLLTWDQLTNELGLDRETVTAWVRAGRLRKWQRGVYGDATLPDAWRRRLMAVLLRLGPDSAVAGRAAASLWGLAGFDGLEVSEFVVPRINAPQVAGATVRGAQQLTGDDITNVGDLRVTTVTRTLQQLPRFGASRRHVLRAAADGCRRGRTSTAEIARFLIENSNGRGNLTLRAALEQLDSQYTRCRSVAEVDGHTFLQQYGFRGYVVNDRVPLSCGRTVEFDVHFRGRWKALEWDSDLHHGSPLEQAADRERDRATSADGYATLRVRVAELRDQPVLARRVAAFLDGDPPEGDNSEVGPS